MRETQHAPRERRKRLGLLTQRTSSRRQSGHRKERSERPRCVLLFSRGVHEALLVRIPDGWSPLNKYAHAFFFLMFFRDALYSSLTRLRTRVGRKPCLLRGRVRPHRSYLQAFHGARPNVFHVVLTIPTPPYLAGVRRTRRRRHGRESRDSCGGAQKG